MTTTAIIITAVASACAAAGIIIFILFYLGMVNPYHPVKKPKSGQIKVACVGDSLTYGFMVGNWFKNNYPAVLNRLLGENYCVNNFSYTNRTTVKDGDYPLVKEKVYAKSLEFKPDIVVILLGTNDSKEINWNREKFIADYGEIIESYAALETSPKIYLLSPLPVFGARGKEPYKLRNSVIVDEIIPAVKELAELKGCKFVDIYGVFEGRRELFADGVHTKVKGSRLLARSVFSALKEN